MKILTSIFLLCLSLQVETVMAELEPNFTPPCTGSPTDQTTYITSMTGEYGHVGTSYQCGSCPADTQVTSDRRYCLCTDSSKVLVGGSCQACPDGQTAKAEGSNRVCGCATEGHVIIDGRCARSLAIGNYTWKAAPTILRTSAIRGSTSRSKCGTDYEVCLGPAIPKSMIASEGVVERMVKCFIPRNETVCPEEITTENRCVFLDQPPSEQEAARTSAQQRTASRFSNYNGQLRNCGSGNHQPCAANVFLPNGCKCSGGDLNFTFDNHANSCARTLEGCNAAQTAHNTRQGRQFCTDVGGTDTAAVNAASLTNAGGCLEYCNSSQGRTDSEKCPAALRTALQTRSDSIRGSGSDRCSDARWMAAELRCCERDTTDNGATCPAAPAAPPVSPPTGIAGLPHQCHQPGVPRGVIPFVSPDMLGQQCDPMGYQLDF